MRIVEKTAWMKSLSLILNNFVAQAVKRFMKYF